MKSKVEELKAAGQSLRAENPTQAEIIISKAEMLSVKEAGDDQTSSPIKWLNEPDRASIEYARFASHLRENDYSTIVDLEEAESF